MNQIRGILFRNKSYIQAKMRFLVYALLFCLLFFVSCKSSSKERQQTNLTNETHALMHHKFSIDIPSGFSLRQECDGESAICHYSYPSKEYVIIQEWASILPFDTMLMSSMNSTTADWQKFKREKDGITYRKDIIGKNGNYVRAYYYCPLRERVALWDSIFNHIQILIK